MTFDDAVRIMEGVAGAKALAVREGAFGPVLKVALTPSPKLSANMVGEDGLLIVRLDAPGGGIFFGADAPDDATLTANVNALLDWQAGERDAELVELGAITDPAPRTAMPRPFIVEGTVMSAPEAMLSTLPNVQEVYDVLGEPFDETGTTPPIFEDVWVLLVGLTT